MANRVMSKMAEHGRAVSERIRAENDNLNAVIAAMVGALMSKTNEDNLDISEEIIFVDSDPSTLNEAKIESIGYEDGELVYEDNDNEEASPLDSLPLNTRIELAEKLADLLEE